MEKTKDRLQQELDLQHEASQILLTIKMLDKAYSGTYISRVLTGESQFGWKDESHTHIESFGSLDNYYPSQVEDIIYFLTRLGFIDVKDASFGSLEIAQIGEAFLAEPRKLSITKDKLFKPWYEIELKKQIRTWRLKLANEFFKRPYQIFTNYTLDQLVKRLPKDQDEISKIAGLEILSIEESGELLTMIGDMIKKIEIDKKTGIYRKAYAPSKRKVKELFEAGLSLEEISRRRKLKLSTTRSYLEILHKAGEIDLIPWIEEKLEPLVLHKATEYFRTAENKSLKVAKNVLELDYDTLIFCKIYADVASTQVV
ncbi:MAG: HRDC domain-containing protein [Bacteroidia bacterium]|nr:HRDC domain-containing protein [Bacteroidia bacterium]